MSPEAYPKEFEKTTDVLPFTKYGLSSLKQFKEAENDLQDLECLKKAGLTQEEINLFKDKEAGLLSHRNKVESNAMQEKLNAIYDKVKLMESAKERSADDNIQAHTSNKTVESSNHVQKSLHKFYPDGHPMNRIKEIEEDLFGHLKDSDMMPITKRRKFLRRFERKKHRIMATENQINISTVANTSKVDRSGSLWDMKEMPQKHEKKSAKQSVIGPQNQTMYTIKDNKIVRLEPVDSEKKEFKAVDIISPVNSAEVNLLEGTKMSLHDIKKLDKFKDYEPGIPSKVLYVKNIAPIVAQEQLSHLFKRFSLSNGEPIDVRLMKGRMRGQAFVTFQNKEVSIKAMEATNGIILSGRPIIIQFGRNTNKIDDNI